MKKITLALLTLLSLNLSAQDYFQQEVNYTIDVELNDKNYTLKGMEYIDTNNSPNDLGFLWVHICLLFSAIDWRINCIKYSAN